MYFLFIIVLCGVLWFLSMAGMLYLFYRKSYVTATFVKRVYVSYSVRFWLKIIVLWIVCFVSLSLIKSMLDDIGISFFEGSSFLLSSATVVLTMLIGGVCSRFVRLPLMEAWGNRNGIVESANPHDMYSFYGQMSFLDYRGRMQVEEHDSTLFSWRVRGVIGSLRRLAKGNFKKLQKLDDEECARSYVLFSTMILFGELSARVKTDSGKIFERVPLWLRASWLNAEIGWYYKDSGQGISPMRREKLLSQALERLSFGTVSYEQAVKSVLVHNISSDGEPDVLRDVVNIWKRCLENKDVFKNRYSTIKVDSTEDWLDKLGEASGAKSMFSAYADKLPVDDIIA